MPQSMAIGAFVLGAVLLLISLVRGGFKIFGAEISGTAGFLGRPVAFVIGIILIVTGFYFEQSKSTTDNVSNASPPQGNAVPLPEVARQTSVAQAQAAPRLSRPVSAPVEAASEPPEQPAPKAATPEQPIRRVDVTWRESTGELQQLFAGLSQQEQAILGLAVLSTGMDIYAVRVRITNTGNAPVTISPENVRIHFGVENTAAATMDHPRFLHAGVVQPNRSLEGLVTFRARPDIGAAIRLGQGTLSYEDDSTQVTYNGR